MRFSGKVGNLEMICMIHSNHVIATKRMNERKSFATFLGFTSFLRELFHLSAVSKTECEGGNRFKVRGLGNKGKSERDREG